MTRPFSTPDHFRNGNNGNNGNYQPRYSLDEDAAAGPNLLEEVDHLRSENAQLRSLCADLEQALHEATQQADTLSADERLREYEQLIEEKSDTIRQLHQQLQDTQSALIEAEGKPKPRQGPMPREDELLKLSEDLETERRQLQEDEQTLMEQMRQMEMTMARERAEMARQRNDLQRLSGEIRHELERLERNGALQTKMDELKAKLQDATSRRGAAPARPASSSALPTVKPQAKQQPPAEATETQPPQRGGSFMGRLFGGNK